MTQTTMQQATTTKKKINLPKWVFKNLNDYGNCALPNECNDIPKEELELYLSEKAGRNIKVRQAGFVKTESAAKKLEINCYYYIAEERK